MILYCNIIILSDHRRICGPSLTETSLCGAYLYICTEISVELSSLHSECIFYQQLWEKFNSRKVNLKFPFSS